MINMCRVIVIIYSFSTNITNNLWKYFIFHFEYLSCKRLNISKVYKGRTILY